MKFNTIFCFSLFFLLIVSVSSALSPCDVTLIKEATNETFIAVAMDSTFPQLQQFNYNFCPIEYPNIEHCPQSEIVVEGFKAAKGRTIRVCPTSSKYQFKPNTIYKLYASYYEQDRLISCILGTGDVYLTVATRPSAPIVKVESLVNSVNISWTTTWPQSQSLDKITQIETCIEPPIVDCVQIPGSQKSLQLPILHDGKLYKITSYYVNTKIGKGSGGVVYYTSPMTAPRSVTFAYSTYSSLEVKWIMNITIDNIRYNVCISSDTEQFCDMMVTPTNLSKVFTALTSNTAYLANVTAIGEQNQASTSSVYYGYTNPKNFEIICKNQTNSSIAIEWYDTSNHLEQISYTIEYLRKNTSNISSPFTMISLSADTEYSISIFSTSNLGGKQTISTSKCKTLPSPPPPIPPRAFSSFAPSPIPPRSSSSVKPSPDVGPHFDSQRLLFLLIIPLVGSIFIVIVVFVIIISFVIRTRRNKTIYYEQQYDEENENLRQMEEFQRYGSTLNSISLDHQHIDYKDFVINSNDIEAIESVHLNAESMVVKAKWKKLIVIVKYFGAGFENKQKFDQWRRETHFLATLKHPNIVNFYGIILDSKKFGIVMEYCSKGSLKNVLKQEHISVEKKKKIISDILKGIEYLHEKNVIHRDLKLDNILIDEHFNAKIADFGISTSLSKTLKKDLTKGVGTDQYGAPEVTLGMEYSFACDMFSFAMILYCLLSNQEYPFTIYDEKEHKQIPVFNGNFLIAKDQNFRPDVSKIDETIWNDYIYVMKQCWKQDSNQRLTVKQVSDLIH